MIYRDYLRLSCEAEQKALKYPEGSPRYELFMKLGWRKLAEAKAAPKERK